MRQSKNPAYFMMKLPRELREELDECSWHVGESRSTIVRTALIEYLERTTQRRFRVPRVANALPIVAEKQYHSAPASADTSERSA